MIYGQSGGGSKVTTLMGMPSATNLFHRAAAQSGGGGNIPSKEQQTELARQLMKISGWLRMTSDRCRRWSGPSSLPQAMRLLPRSIQQGRP